MRHRGSGARGFESPCGGARLGDDAALARELRRAESTLSVLSAAITRLTRALGASLSRPVKRPAAARRPA